MAAAEPPTPTPRKPQPSVFLVNRKVTHPSAESKVLGVFSNVQDAIDNIRILAAREDGVESHDDWRSEIGAHGELRFTNRLADGSAIVYEAQKMPIRPEGYGKPLVPKNIKRSRESLEEDEMANWKGWDFIHDLCISESELFYWAGWQLKYSSDSMCVKAKKLMGERNGDKDEEAHWDGYTQEYTRVGGYIPVSTDALEHSLECLFHYD